MAGSANGGTADRGSGTGGIAGSGSDAGREGSTTGASVSAGSAGGGGEAAACGSDDGGASGGTWLAGAGAGLSIGRRSGSGRLETAATEGATDALGSIGVGTTGATGVGDSPVHLLPQRDARLGEAGLSNRARP